jgi:phosphoadenosine phosphosulfate reductase
MSHVVEARTLIRQTLDAARDSACITCSFQIDGMVLLHLIRQYDPEIPVLFLDTGYHFGEVYAYRDLMKAKWGLNLVELKSSLPVAQQERRFGILNQTDPSRCCEIRKVAPLMAGLEPYEVWFTGIRRQQASTRQALQHEEWHELPTGKKLKKVMPLAFWGRDEILDYAREHDIPQLPLYEQGYTSIGCAPCTQKPIDPNDLRSGRWGGQKVECGIHTMTRKG